MPILSPKRQVTLPKELCDRLRVRPGDQVEFLEHNGRITILKKTKRSQRRSIETPQSRHAVFR